MKHLAPHSTCIDLPLFGDEARDAVDRDPTRGGVYIVKASPGNGFQEGARAELSWRARYAHFWVRCGDRDFGSVAATMGDDRVDVSVIPGDRRAALEVMVRDWILAALRRPGAVTTDGTRDATTTRIPLGVFARQARDLVRRARAECKDSDDSSAIFVDPRTDEATIEGQFTVAGMATTFASNLWYRSRWSCSNVVDDVERRDMVIATVRETFRDMVNDVTPPAPIDAGLAAATADTADTIPPHPSRPAWMQMLEDLALPDDGVDDPGRPWLQPGTRRLRIEHPRTTWLCKRFDGTIAAVTREDDGSWTTSKVDSDEQPTVPNVVAAESLDLAVARAIHELGQSLTVARIAVSPDAVAGDHPAGPGLRRALDQALAELTCLRGAYERTVARG